ncbi:AcrR family transcriptional regulator [Nonomuraea thailandensis]|uniref:AcrR family transcriptional regulator n=1 Tax=Nonomuraea thailandensis TaxID=1188745 RepID=A0A9X2GG61_9ACTN|nr:TetR/AcrR family transcriptional regulator [Nonomuraea thailandensis]MCP2357947.1 AcrR family transcriptional regulator [Nonomuraea thailandensis]
MAGRRTRGQGAHHEQRRDEIADAVLAIVAERGLAAVSLTTVAGQAGISPGRVQHYFPAKRQLIEAAFERGNELSGVRIRRKTGSDPDSADPRLVLTTVLTELIPYDAATEAHMRVRQSFHALGFAEESIAARLRVLYAGFHHQMAQLIRRDQEAGRVRGDVRADDTALALVALAEGLAAYVLTGVVEPQVARDRLLDEIAGLYG